MGDDKRITVDEANCMEMKSSPSKEQLDVVCQLDPLEWRDPRMQ